MLRPQIMIEKYCIVDVIAQEILRVIDVICRIQMIARKALREPFITPRVIFQEKHPDRMAMGLDAF